MVTTIKKDLEKLSEEVGQYNTNVDTLQETVGENAAADLRAKESSDKRLTAVEKATSQNSDDNAKSDRKEDLAGLLPATGLCRL